jgi:hypothetical protein
MRRFLNNVVTVTVAVYAMTWVGRAPAFAAWSEVQSVARFVSRSPSTQTLSLFAPLNSGDCVAVFVGWRSTAPAQLTGVSDGTNVYTILDTSASASSAMATAYNFKVAGGPMTLTFTFDRAVDFVLMAADEFGQSCTGLRGHGIGSAQSNPGTERDAVTSGSVVTASSGNLLWGVSFQPGLDGATYAHGTGFTRGASGDDVMTEWLSQGFNAAVTFTVNPSTTAITAAIQFAP